MSFTFFDFDLMVFEHFDTLLNLFVIEINLLQKLPDILKEFCISRDNNLVLRCDDSRLFDRTLLSHHYVAASFRALAKCFVKAGYFDRLDQLRSTTCIALPSGWVLLDGSRCTQFGNRRTRLLLTDSCNKSLFRRVILCLGFHSLTFLLFHGRPGVR